jgi:hypothetical protein
MMEEQYQDEYLKLKLCLFYKLLNFINEEKILQDNLYKYGYFAIYEAARTFLFCAKEWLYFTQVLNVKENWYLLELYKDILKFQIEKGQFVNDKTWNDSQFTSTCLKLWCESPALRNNVQDINFTILSDPQICIPNNAEVPRIRRGELSRCAYCDNKERCHFSLHSSKCTWSNSTKNRCYPMSGIHCCNGHGSKVLLDRGSDNSTARTFVTDNGRNCPNIKKIGHAEKMFDEKTDINLCRDKYYYGRLPTIVTYEYLLGFKRAYNIKSIELSDEFHYKYLNNFLDSYRTDPNFFLYHQIISGLFFTYIQESMLYAVDFKPTSFVNQVCFAQTGYVGPLLISKQ